MNIFILSKNLKKCAQYHCDKHVVKMILEHTQILSTVCRLSGLEVGYKKTHVKHPCVIWAGESEDNWLWLKKLNDALHEEYQYRYGENKVHKSYLVSTSLPLPSLPKIGMTQFAQAMPEQYKNNDPVKAYRNYYINEKYKIVSWTQRTKPHWFKNISKKDQYNGVNAEDNDGLSLIDLEYNLDLINKYYDNNFINYKLVPIYNIILNKTQSLYIINPEGLDSKFSHSLKLKAQNSNVINANIQLDNSTCGDHSLILLTKILKLEINLLKIGISTVENNYGKHASLYIINDSNIDLSDIISRIINSYKHESKITNTFHSNNEVTEYLTIEDFTIFNNTEDIALLGNDSVF